MASTRRLAAIMFTDTVGYTASTQADEARTLDLLRQQAELVRPLLAVHQGREVKSTGDGFLVEFDSALRATQCAVGIQRRIYERNAEGGLSRIQIRIGIHLGDVVQRADDLLGDAVNIAARLEPLAEPGGICVSGAVQEQVRNKIPEKLEKLAPTALKGVEVPMDVYRVVLPWTVPEPPTAGLGPSGIAVLPFSNISPDPKDEYFADGLTEELISVLSQLRELRVIARTSVMPYKSTSKGVAQIGAELRVSSILEGSVRKAGNRLRVTAQMIDVGSESHVWAMTFDRELDDIFAVQADIARGVFESLKDRLHAPALTQTAHPPRTKSEAYELYLKGRVDLNRANNEEEIRRALECFRDAVGKDPEYAAAHAGMSIGLHWLVDSGFDPEGDGLRRSKESALRALRLEPLSAEAHDALASLSIHECEWEDAERESRKALELNPSLSAAHLRYSQVLRLTGRPREAMEHAHQALELDPLAASAMDRVGVGYLDAGEYDKAISYFRNAIEADRDRADLHSDLGVAYIKNGSLEEGLAELQTANSLAGGTNPLVLGDLAWGYSQVGRTDEAAKILSDLLSQAKQGGPFVTAIAGVYATSGDFDQAFEWLERGVREEGPHQPGTLLSVWFERIRLDPRFKKMLRTMGMDPR